MYISYSLQSIMQSKCIYDYLYFRNEKMKTERSWGPCVKSQLLCGRSRICIWTTQLQSLLWILSLCWNENKQDQEKYNFVPYLHPYFFQNQVRTNNWIESFNCSTLFGSPQIIRKNRLNGVFQFIFYTPPPAFCASGWTSCVWCSTLFRRATLVLKASQARVVLEKPGKEELRRPKATHRGSGKTRDGDEAWSLEGQTSVPSWFMKHPCPQGWCW